MMAQRADKIALRQMSRSKYFEFDSLETKGWDMKKFTDPQGWTNFVSLQEHNYEELVRGKRKMRTFSCPLSKVCKSQSLKTFSLKL